MVEGLLQANVSVLIMSGQLDLAVRNWIFFIIMYILGIFYFMDFMILWVLVIFYLRFIFNNKN